MRGVRHHRRDLLARERVVVAGKPRALGGQVLEEELQLIADRTMQPDLAVGTPTHLDTFLEHALISRADRNRERRAQQRWPTRCLQIREQVSRLLGPLVAKVRHALLAVGLRAHDLVGVLDLPARQPQRQLVR